MGTDRPRPAAGPVAGEAVLVVAVLQVVAGLLLLGLGGELLVRGAVGLARRLGVSPLVVGLTFVGFGTSAPELVTSVQAGLAGSPGIAWGNVVGSNLFNILVVLGAAAVVAPLAVSRLALRRDAVVGLGAAALVAALMLAGATQRVAGAVLVGLLLGYLALAWRQERAAPADGDVVAGPEVGVGRAACLAVLGFAVVVAGARLLVTGAVEVADALGVAEEVVGLTVVAVGTAAPELVTAVVATARGPSGLALGNVLGSNVWNLLGIGGATALVAPGPVPAHLARVDAPLLVLVTALLLVMVATGRRISRREGAVLLAGYAGYLWWLWP